MCSRRVRDREVRLQDRRQFTAHFSSATDNIRFQKANSRVELLGLDRGLLYQIGRDRKGFIEPIHQTGKAGQPRGVGNARAAKEHYAPVFVSL
ncbi:hypothetical protein D3C71_1538230 [compost metagenome]